MTRERAAQPVVDFIRDVHDRGRAEIRWHTTWQRDAVDLGRRLGLPDFGVADAPEYARLDEFLLIVCPHPRTGLCKRHLRQIDAFLP